MGLKKNHFHVNLASLFWNKHPTCSKSVVAFYLGLCFPSPYSRNKAKVNVSSAHCRLVEVTTTMRELSLVLPKGGRGRQIEVYTGLSSHCFPQLFRDFDYWPLRDCNNYQEEGVLK